MTSLSLPPVAKSFFTFCKKCDADRYHVVMAHTTATSAKMKCEVCHSVKTYTLPKQGNKTSTGKTLTGAALAKRAASENSRRSSHKNEYEMLMSQDAATFDYSMKTKFAKGSKLNHPKFGMGFIKEAMNDKIEVIFPEEVKTLIHNRP
ncbi:MAG: hypothetical protein ACLGGX_10890 [Bdellovibrionia bacterium]